MSIETLAHEVSASVGEAVTYVEAKHGKSAPKAKGGFKSLKQLVSVLKAPGHKAYAEAYYKWVVGGRKGAAPADASKDVRTWKFIRSAVQQIISNGGK